MTETKAPSPLPTKLPKGAAWIGFVSKQRYTLTEEARLGDGFYLGHSIAPDGQDNSYFPADLVDWSSVPYPAQPDEPKGGPMPGERWHSDQYATHWGPLLVLRAGVHYNGRTDDVECRGGGASEIIKPGSVGIFRRSDLTRRLPHPTGEGPSVPEPAHNGRPEPVDPYVEHNRRIGKHAGAVSWGLDEDDRHRAAIKQHLADLDRPLLKLGGRFGKKVEMTHPAGWPEGSDHE